MTLKIKPNVIEAFYVASLCALGILIFNLSIWLLSWNIKTIPINVLVIQGIIVSASYLIYTLYYIINKNLIVFTENDVIIAICDCGSVKKFV
jgi:hypothetical protein